VALLNEIALGLYIGLLTGMFTALLVFSLAFVFQYLANVAFPATMGLMIGLGSAGLQGGMFRLLRDPVALRSPVIITALLLTLLITNYSQKRGQELAKQVPPKSVLIGRVRRRTFSPDVVKHLGRFGQVTVTVSGEVRDIEGYPPLPESARAAIRTGEWVFPADLPLSEIEKRLRERLTVEHDLTDVAVAVDERGEATVSAAPPTSGLSRRVPRDKHATTVEGLVPTGTAYGDKVEITVDGETLTGTVVSVTPPAPKKDEKKGEDGEGPAGQAVAQTAVGGKERIALAVKPGAVASTVGADVSKFVVAPRGENREYEFVSLLRKQGNAFRKVVAGADGPFVGKQLTDLRAEYGVDVLAVKSFDSWVFAPRERTRVEAEDELFLTGPADAIQRVRGATA
jgi:hypothetical protein